MKLTDMIQEAEREAEKTLGIEPEDKWITEERRKANDKLWDELNEQKKGPHRTRPHARIIYVAIA